MNNTFDALEPDNFYHIYNRGINSQNIFHSTENYYFFLNKAKEYLIDYVDVYAYCLMSNHYHFVVKIKSQAELLTKIDSFDLIKQSEHGLHSAKSLVSKQFGTFFNSYTQAFNKENNRHGALFERPFKRLRIKSEDYLLRCIIYVHQNSFSFNTDLSEYAFSSYKSVISNSKTDILREEVRELFGGLENFEYCHQFAIEL